MMCKRNIYIYIYIYIYIEREREREICECGVNSYTSIDCCSVNTTMFRCVYTYSNCTHTEHMRTYIHTHTHTYKH